MKITLGLIALILIVNQVQANNCPTNCASCGLKDGSSDVFCFVCGYGKLWNNGDCSQKNPDANCSFHTAAGCLGCSQGWYLNLNTQKCEQVGTPIASCYAGANSPSGKKMVSGPLRYRMNVPEDQLYVSTPQVTCNVCDGFYPSSDMSQCSGPLIPGDNCQWGTLDDYGNNHCMKCKSGFISQVGVCQSSSGSNVGCIYQNANGQCVQCTQGYYMKYTGVCAINSGVQDK